MSAGRHAARPLLAPAPVFSASRAFTIRFVAVYLLLGNDEEYKARAVEKLRRGRNAEPYDASEAAPEAVVSACNSSSSGTSTPGTPPRSR